MLRKYFKFVLNLWATSDSVQLKLHSFLVLKKICTLSAKTELDYYLKVLFLQKFKKIENFFLLFKKFVRKYICITLLILSIKLGETMN